MRFDAHMKPIPEFQPLPTKIKRTQKIEVGGKIIGEHRYQVRLTWWVMDCPYSQKPPKLALTIAHGKGVNRQSIRIMFDCSTTAWCFLKEAMDFIEKEGGTLDNVLWEALAEWRELHQRENFDSNIEKISKISQTKKS